MNRREFMQAAAAAAAIWGAGAPWARLAARQALTQEAILDMEPLGNVTLLHLTDLHAQLRPVWFREPSANIGVGAATGLPPHLTGADFLERFSIAPGSADAYALTSEDFVALARAYGRMGGIDRMATLVKAVRAARPDQTLLLDGGDTWQGSYTALKTGAQDMVEVMKLLGPDAMTGHWEFTYGSERVNEIRAALPFPFLAQNILDKEWQEPAFDAVATFERGGIRIAVIGQAFPYTPIANPGWMMPDWSFGIREDRIRENVDAARAGGAELVVLLSHNGFDVDRKLASRVDGIDVILTGHTHDALPEVVTAGRTLLVASGSNGKFLSRLDLDVSGGEVRAHRYRLMPVFADAIAPDPAMAALVGEVRAPHEAALGRVLAHTDSLLYRRGTFNGTMDDLILDALRAGREAEIALSPGFRWGTSLLPGEPITVEDLYDACAITYPAVYRSTMSGKTIRDILEDVADNLFNPDPYYQQGGDMVRVGGMAYMIDPRKKIGTRVSDMTLEASGEPIDPGRDYTVAGWASVNQETEGPAIWDVVEQHLADVDTVTIAPNRSVTVVGT